MDKGLLRTKLELRIQAAAAPGESGPVAMVNSRAGGPVEWKLDELAQYERLQIKRPWAGHSPKTTITAQRVEGSVALTRKGSPYLITARLLVPSGATLTIEAGAVVLFAPGTGIRNQGTLNILSDSDWIVLANAQDGSRWKGVDCTDGRATCRRCLVLGADTAFTMHKNREGLVATHCTFAENDIAISVDSGSAAKVNDSLFFHNRLGLIGHGEGGSVQFAQCLLLDNKCGGTANFQGRCEASNSTFYGNDAALGAAEQGKTVHVSRSNILTTSGTPIGSRGGRVMAAGIYWGQNGLPSAQTCDVNGSLASPVLDAMPKLPACDYLGLGLSVRPMPASPVSPADPQKAPGRTTAALPQAVIPATDANPFLGVWEKSTLQGWARFTIKPGGRAVTADGLVGSWSLRGQSLVIAWPGQNQMYEMPVGDTMIGKTVPSSPQGKSIPLKSRRIANAGDH